MGLVDELATGSDTPLADNDPILLTSEDPAHPSVSSIGSDEQNDPIRPKPRPAVQAATFVASKRDPARWAKVTTLAVRTGLQPDFVDRNYDTLVAADAQQTHARQAADVSPTLANWLSDPDNATLAQHELAPLARVDAGAKLMAPRESGPGALDAIGTATATGSADLAASAGHLAVAWGLTSPQQAARFVADMNQRAASLRRQAPDYAKDFSQAMQEHAGAVDRAYHATLDRQSIYLRTDILGALARYVDPAMHAGQDAHTLGELLGMIGAAATRPRGFAYAGLEGLASMAPMLGGAAAGAATGAAIGSFVPGVGTAVGGTAGTIAGTFLGMAPVNVGAEINAELTKRGVDVTNAAALERAFSDPDLMASVRAKAEKAGITNALVASLFAGFAGKLAAGATTKAGTAVAHAADVGVQAGGMGVAHAAGQAAAGEPVSVGDALSTAIQTLGVSAGMEAIGASRRAAFHGDPVEAAMQATQQADAALQAHHDAQALAEIGDAVKEAKTTAEVPDRVKALVETATGGPDASQVFFQLDDWNKYWSSRGASPAKAARDVLGNDRVYYEAQASGSAIAVPLGDYVARVGPTEHWDGLLASARTKPDGMSLAEAQEYLHTLPATMREIAEDAVTQPGEKATPSNADSATEVGTRVRAQLERAGLSESAARAQSSLYEQTFRTLGSRAGVDPLALFDRYNLSIQRGRASAAITKAASESRAAEAEIAALVDGDPDHAAELARPRTESGRLKNLKKATDDELANEYATLVDLNAQEKRGATSLESDVPGAQYVGMKPAAIAAAGRVAQRGKSIAKLEAELTRRGIEHAEAYMRGYQNIQNVDPTEFAFSINDVVPDVSSDASAAAPPPRTYADVAREIDRAEADIRIGRTMGARGVVEDAKARLAALEEEAARDFPDEHHTFQQPAFHGSPHVFDEFSLHKIGTGEGAQAYGWGLYFAGKKEVAEFYRETLSKNQRLSDPDLASRWDALKGLLSHIDYLGFDTATQAVQAIRANPDWATRWDLSHPAGDMPQLEARDFAADIQAALDSYDARRKELGGRLYHVEIPEDDTMLLWDRPLDKQPEKVQEALRSLGIADKAAGGGSTWDEIDTSTQFIGAELYHRLAQNLGESHTVGASRASNDKAASLALSGAGVTGIKYADANSRGSGPKTYNYVIFDDNLVQIKAYEQATGDQGKPRGQIVFGDNGIAIDLLEKADRSTFLHETGHFYLRVLADLAAPASAPDAIKADYATIRDWLGVTDGAELTRAQHEQFARGFEAYLMEGKAPSPALRGVFYRFRDWLVGVYRQLGALNVSLTPEVRRVFDRLLASDEEIAQAERENAAQPLFDDPKAVGLNPAQAESYRAAVAEAHQAAVEELTTRMMQQIRREESKEWAALRKPVEAQVTREIDASPAYRALEFLRRGTNPDGSALPDDVTPLKLARADVVDMIGKDAAATLPKSLFGAEGVHPDLVAELFGFESGRDLLDAIVDTPPRTQAIRQLTDQRMQIAHGERMSDAEVHQAATQAVHNEKRAQLLRRELELLASNDLAALKGLVRAVTKPVPPSAEVKRQAADIIGGKAVREIRPDLFEKAAAKAARQAREALLKGDVDGAFEAKRKELLATEVAQAAATAKQSVETALDEFRKVFRRDERLADTRDLDLVNAARAILATFGVGRTEKAPAEYLDAMRRYDPEQYETVKAMVDDATQGLVPGDYKALTYADFSAMREAVRSLWDLSRRTRQIEIDGQRLDRKAVEAELTARLAPLTPTDPPPGYTRAVTRWEKSKRTLMSGRAWLRRTEHWVDAMDAGDANGVFRRYLWNPISEGATKYRVARRAALEQYLGVVKAVEHTMGGGAIPSPELSYEFKSKAELLGALLHSGNESNLRKLLLGRHWGELTESGAADASRWHAFIGRMQREGTLGKAEYDYVQGVWDLLEGLKPDAQRAHRDMYGHYFAEITADPFATPFGSYRGGYFPAKADPFLVPDQAIKREAESILGSDNSFMFPTTGRGFTKSRVEYNRPLIIDASYVPSAIDAVLKFTHIEPRVRDVARVVMSRGFRPELDRFDPTVGGEMLVPWLQRAAQQAVQIRGKNAGFDQFWSQLRRRTGLQILALNVVNSLQQLTGVSISAVKVPASSLGGALWRYIREPKAMAAEIVEKSAFMSTRMTNSVAEVQHHIDQLLLDPSKYDDVRAFAEKHGHVLTAATQGLVDTVTWAGAYEHAIASGNADTESVRIADAAVRETQGSGAPEDLARYEAQTPFLRTFTMFSGYFNMQANLLGSEFATTVRTLGLKKGAGRLLAVYVLGFAAPAVLSDAIQAAANGKPLDEDDDGPIDDVLKLFFGSQFTGAARMLPVAGPAAEFAVKHFGTHSPNDRLTTSAAIQSVERSLESPADVYQAIRDKQLTTKGIKDVLTALGLLTGLPVAPLAKPLGYLNDVNTHKATPTGAVDFTRGLLTGR